MSDRCEPPPELRGKPGYHLVAGVDNVTGQIGEFPAYWTGEGQRPFARMWKAWGVVHEPDEHGWRYLSPVATPAEVEALRADLERERMRLAACGVIAMSDTRESAKLNRDMHPDYRSASCDDVARRVDECMTLRARVAELEHLLRRYLTETPLGHQPHMIAHQVEAALSLATSTPPSGAREP